MRPKPTVPAPVSLPVARRLVPRYQPSLTEVQRHRRAYRACKPGSLGSVKSYRRKRLTKRANVRGDGNGSVWALLCIACTLAYGFWARFHN